MPALLSGSALPSGRLRGGSEATIDASFTGEDGRAVDGGLRSGWLLRWCFIWAAGFFLLFFGLFGLSGWFVLLWSVLVAWLVWLA